MKEDHESLMREAICVSNNSINNGGGPFGAVIVRDGKIIASCSNSVTKDNDPTAHAEVNAIRQACSVLNTFNLSGCDIYTSCEPCPMCLGAIYWARLDRVFYANNRTDASDAGFDDSLIYEEIAKPPQDRKIPFIQMLRSDALQTFKTWHSIDSKTEY